jgi:FKBP-type peptidyl-prolyl cis-trans isomerase
MRPTALVLVLAFAAGGCRHFGFQDRAVEVDRNTIAAADGVTYEELFIGQGKPAGPADSVLIDYTVWLADGTETRVDSTLDRGVPVLVTLGSAFVDGLNSGLANIRANGRRKVFVPAQQAYGSKGVEGAIPPDMDLVFEVHALEVHPHAP